MPTIRRPRVIDPTAPNPPVRDRRAQPRYAPAIGRVLTVWKDRHWVEQPGVLLDIAHGGAAVVAPSPPPAAALVFLMLEDEQVPTEVAKARVVEVISVTPSACLIRLRFESPCPPALFEAATCGFDALRTMLN